MPLFLMSATVPSLNPKTTLMATPAEVKTMPSATRNTTTMQSLTSATQTNNKTATSNLTVTDSTTIEG